MAENGEHTWGFPNLPFWYIHPGCCIAEAGEVVPLTLNKAFKSTRLYPGLAIAMLGLFSSLYHRGMKALDVEAGRIDVAKGYGGVLVRPEFFAPAAFDIPDLLWTVDNTWLSGQLALAVIPIHKALTTELSRKTDVAALVDYVYADHNLEQANAACIRHFQERHGIWQRVKT